MPPFLPLWFAAGAAASAVPPSPPTAGVAALGCAGVPADYAAAGLLAALDETTVMRPGVALHLLAWQRDVDFRRFYSDAALVWIDAGGVHYLASLYRNQRDANTWGSWRVWHVIPRRGPVRVGLRKYDARPTRPEFESFLSETGWSFQHQGGAGHATAGEEVCDATWRNLFGVDAWRHY